jgi:hypothetical protein
MTKVSAAHVRRVALAAAPLLGGLACAVGAFADPDPSALGFELVEVYTANWDAVQLKSAAYHYGYMFIGATAIGLAALVRSGRGVALALVAGALAILGISTLPGMLIADFYASAGGQLVGPEQMREIEVESQGGWGAGAIVGPGMLGFALSLPLAALAAVRAGLLRWWAPLLVLAGIASFALGAATPLGNVMMTVWFALLGLAILRMPITAFGPRAATPHTTAPEGIDAAVPASVDRAERPAAIA